MFSIMTNSQTPLSAYIEAVEIALQKPNPQIKMQTALFLSRLLRQHNMHTSPLDCIKERLGPALTKVAFKMIFFLSLVKKETRILTKINER